MVLVGCWGDSVPAGGPRVALLGDWASTSQDDVVFSPLVCPAEPCRQEATRSNQPGGRWERVANHQLRRTKGPVPNRLGALMPLCHPDVHPIVEMLTPSGDKPRHTVQVCRTISDTARVEDLEIRLGHRVATQQTSPNGRHRPTGPASAESHWWVECADPFGRCRAMNVVIQHGKVVVVAPPGQSAVLSAQQTRQLGSALAKAADHSTGPAPD